MLQVKDDLTNWYSRLYSVDHDMGTDIHGDLIYKIPFGSLQACEFSIMGECPNCASPLRSTFISYNIHVSRSQTWWRHNMKMLSTLLALCVENPLVDGSTNSRIAVDLRRHASRMTESVSSRNKSFFISFVDALYLQEMSSFWRYCHRLHGKLSISQLLVQPVMTISSQWQHFHFSESRRTRIGSF